MKTQNSFFTILCLYVTCVNLSADSFEEPEATARREAIESHLDRIYETSGSDVLPELYKVLEENIEDGLFVGKLVGRLCGIAYNPTIEGDSEVLKIMRRVIDVYNDAPPYAYETSGAREYLKRKGDASDLARLPNDAVLKARVGGINVMSGDTIFNFRGSDGQSMSNIYIDFIPSVINVGTQALYVHEILKRYWEILGNIPNEFPPTERHTYLERSKQAFLEMPEELLAIVVSFDADGTPVCNVDLTKYGLSMPIITPKPEKEQYRATAPWYNNTVVFPHETENAQPPATDATAPAPDSAPEAKRPDKTETPPPPSPNLTWLYLAIGILAIICAWLGFARRKKK